MAEFTYKATHVSVRDDSPAMLLWENPFVLANEDGVVWYGDDPDDWKRIEPAPLERRVTFRPGYNYLHETGPKSRGQHGMEIHFTLLGEAGAVDVGIFTHWTPLGPVDEDKPGPGRDPAVHCDYTDRNGFGTIHPPSGACLSMHRPTPFSYDLEDKGGECDLLPSGECYSDVSYTASDPILKAFIDGGEEPVWEALKGWYDTSLLDIEVES